MDRLKSLLAFWPVLAIIGTILAIGYEADAVKQSKLDVAVFEPFAKDHEKRLTTTEVIVKIYGDDLKLIKDQMRNVAIATGARVVIPAPDGGVK